MLEFLLFRFLIKICLVYKGVFFKKEILVLFKGILKLCFNFLVFFCGYKMRVFMLFKKL